MEPSRYAALSSAGAASIHPPRMVLVELPHLDEKSALPQSGQVEPVDSVELYSGDAVTGCPVEPVPSIPPL